MQTSIIQGESSVSLTPSESATKAGGEDAPRRIALLIGVVGLATFGTFTSSVPTAAATGGPNFYVSTTGSDHNDCSQAQPCASLFVASQAASAYFASLPTNGKVTTSVSIEPGTYSTAIGRSWNGSSFQSCDSTSTQCLGLQVINATGTQTYPILIKPDPATTAGSASYPIVFQRPSSANTTTQQTPLLAVASSSWVDMAYSRTRGRKVDRLCCECLLGNGWLCLDGGQRRRG